MNRTDPYKGAWQARQRLARQLSYRLQRLSPRFQCGLLLPGCLVLGGGSGYLLLEALQRKGTVGPEPLARQVPWLPPSGADTLLPVPQASLGRDSLPVPQEPIIHPKPLIP